ncbi:MAG TPA: xanthine dehydrogenase family protein subunit M [Anaerolineales bacterium]
MISAHPGLPEFDYIRPKTLAEASEFLAEHPGQARPFLGGTDVFVRMRDGIWKEKFLVDVKNLDGTKEIRFDPETGLTLGAGVNMNQVIASEEIRSCYPILAQACQTVASYPLRTRATIAGNLCNASPAGDTIGACLVSGGYLHVHGVDGLRQEPLDGFFLGPGKTTLKPGDIVTAVSFPPPRPGQAGTYIKLGRNALGDLAIVGVTALGYPDRGLPSGFRFRIALASVAPIPLVATQAETLLEENPVDEASISAAAQAAMDACQPIDDVRGSVQYRKLMARNLTRKALRQVWGELKPVMELQN